MTNLSAKGYKLFCRGQTLDTVHNGELRFMVAIRQSAMIACYDVCQNDSCDSLRLFGEQIPKAFKVHLRLFLENLGDCCGGCCLLSGLGVNLEFSGYDYSIDSYQVDSIVVKDDGSTYFYTNAYYQSYFYGKQYPVLYFVWKGESLEAHGFRYKQTYTGEWNQGLKEDSYYEEGEWLWDVQMFPFCVGEIIGEGDDWGINATQTLFNNDEKWEFLRPVYTEVISNTRERDRDDDGEIDYKEITYRDRLKAYEIVSEDGNVLSSFLVPEGDYYGPRLILWDGETYFGICVEKKIEEDDYTEDYLYEEYMVIYSIDKNASSVKKIASTPAMRVSPALAERNSTVNVTLDAETVKNGGELIITDSNGRTIGRSHVEAGQTSVPVTTDRMGSGVYNITLTEKGQKVENARIIVK